jgi:hypothetical protein
VVEGKAQLKAYDVRKTLQSRTLVSVIKQAPNFQMSYNGLRRVIQIKDVAKSEKKKSSDPSGGPETDGTGASNESGQDTKGNPFAMSFLTEALQFFGEKFLVVPWSKERIVFQVLYISLYSLLKC